MKISMPSRVIAFLFIALLYALSAAAANATIRHVPADYPTIQQAINAAVNGDTVLVAPGTYVENINFLGKAITVTSEAGPQATIIDGNHGNTVVKFISHEGSSSILSGFTLRNGHNDINSFGGAGVLINGASPTITRNIITNNDAIGSGGGLLVAGSAIISDNEITNNLACDGTGIAVFGGSPTILRNLIARNMGKCFGGGGTIYVLGNAPAQILDNTISDNTFTQAAQGAGIRLFAAKNVLIKDNIIRNNRIAGDGGGIWAVNNTTALITQNLIVGNQASHGGGASFNNIGIVLINNTIAENESDIGADVLIFAHPANQVINNIFIAKPQRGVLFCIGVLPGLPTLRFNNIFSPQGIAYDGTCAGQNGMNGNISADPLFADPVAGDYRLKATSPSIDAGDNSAPNLPAIDLDGKPRIQDGNGDGVAIIDMGAYEFPAPYNLCIQDDSSGSLLQINTTTGAYQFTNCSGLTITGLGTLTSRGGVISFQHYASDRRVTAKIDTSTNKATVTLQLLSTGTTFSITDRNITNNTCSCNR